MSPRNDIILVGPYSRDVTISSASGVTQGGSHLIGQVQQIVTISLIPADECGPEILYFFRAVSLYLVNT
jgi:hypothetical protein